MFWAWAHGKLSTELALEPVLYDIQELNRLALDEGELDFTKVSMATYLSPSVKEKYRLLSSGAALGKGCGPLVVSQKPWRPGEAGKLRLAIPGRDTTACKLAEMALGDEVEEWVELRYDKIMPAVLEGRDVDAGVIIHESRFVYKGLGLECAFDLGQWWEQETGLPLPLGVMLARRDLPENVAEEAEQILRDSIRLADELIDHASGESLWKYMRDNAVELEDQTMRAHVQLYVNRFSVDLGQQGRAAVKEFEKRAHNG
ncbi:MAG TPA: 1,4-dihydroxy-6-naphthoate synthase [Phycisphaerales bacterium]|nr:1,4-dihydroxy-6-naphthoate synthase [Phycisphaerales bacterium]